MLHLRNAAFAQLAISSANLSQEFSNTIKWFDFVVLLKLFRGNSLKNSLNDFLEVISILGSVLQDELIASQILLEDNSWAIYELHLPIQFDLL